MAYQQYIHAFELDLNLNGDSIRKALLSHKISALRRGIFIPDSLIAEMEMFASRNALSDLIDAKYLTKKPNEVCPSCLKAHTLRHASLIGLPSESLDFLDKLLPGQKGHLGYYMDSGNLIKIERD